MPPACVAARVYGESKPTEWCRSECVCVRACVSCARGPRDNRKLARIDAPKPHSTEPRPKSSHLVCLWARAFAHRLGPSHACTHTRTHYFTKGTPVPVPARSDLDFLRFGNQRPGGQSGRLMYVFWIRMCTVHCSNTHALAIAHMHEHALTVLFCTCCDCRAAPAAAAVCVCWRSVSVGRGGAIRMRQTSPTTAKMMAIPPGHLRAFWRGGWRWKGAIGRAMGLLLLIARLVVGWARNESIEKTSSLPDRAMEIKALLLP